ncbi:MAG: polyphosphate kinase 1 [Clostridia bacterium]|nr:polyphosphate kinase 1 [Clostridia bacterium]
MSDNKYKHYINRDLSWMKFNERVLEEAEDPTNPLFERLNFISIYHSNLNEFQRVRVGSMYDRLLLNENEIDPRSGMTVAQQLKAVNKEINRLSPRKNKALLDILSKLEDHGIIYRSGKHFTKYELRFLERYFERSVLPLLSPHIIDKHHPFPFLQNDSVYVAVLLKTKNGSTRLGIIPASGYFERFLQLPSKYIKFTLIENLIYRFADKVFPKHKVIDKTIFSVVRNADIDPDEAFFDHDMSYRDIMEIMVKKRTRLEPIRLDMVRNNSEEIKKQLMKHLNLKSDQVFYNEMPVQLGFVSALKNAVQKAGGHDDLFYTPVRPQPAHALNHHEPLIPQLLEKDVLLSYPYEDIRDFVKLLDEAAEDPDVVSIKITLYRVARNSRIVDALIRAAENGKEVTAVVELRARFDEENNIDWSKRLQEAGVSLIYGIEHYKVHSKLAVITLKHDNDVRFITQVGTGNYNEITSRFYTDLSYITSDHDIGLNALDVFKNLSMGSLVEESKELLVSPLTLKQTVMSMIDEEIAEAKAGRPASLQFKLNSLNDMDIIDKLIEASDAGVKIKMLIRGICCLNVEETGKTRNIEISSIVGRFLEHSRIYIFGEGERERVYIASADFMSRNTERRVEVGIPVTDEHSKQELKNIMSLMLSDNVKARHQVGDGVYKKIPPKDGERAIDSQYEQIKRAYEAAGNRCPVPEPVLAK